MEYTLTETDLYRLITATKVATTREVLSELGYASDYITLSAARMRGNRARVDKAIRDGELKVKSLGQRGKGIKACDFEAWISLNRVL
jgi:hypothetical protein